MARNPFKVGDYVVADDPFNGHVEGVVVEVGKVSVRLRTVSGPKEHILYYNYRAVQRSF